MMTAEKKRLALEGRSDVVAAGIRVKAARLMIGQSQKQLGLMINRGTSTINNIERGHNFPTWQLMTYLYDEHRVDMNFIVIGAFAQLPADVSDKLFSRLAEIEDQSTLKPGPGRRRGA